MQILSADSIRPVAEKLQRQGVELVRRPRWRMPWSDTYQPASADQVAAALEKDRLHVRSPDGSLLLPVHTAEDFQELATLSGVSHEPLSEADLEQELRRLAEQGFRFFAQHDGVLGEVGLYGAYNALSDPSHGLTGLALHRADLKLPMATQDQLHRLGSALENEDLKTLLGLGRSTEQKAALLSLGLERGDSLGLRELGPNLSAASRVLIAERLLADPDLDRATLPDLLLPDDAVQVASRVWDLPGLAGKLMADTQLSSETRLMVKEGDPLTWIDALLAKKTDQGWRDAARIGRAAVETLAGTPTADAALEVSELHHVGSKVRLYKAVLQAPEQDLAPLGLKLSQELRATGYDQAWSEAAEVGRAFAARLTDSPAARAAVAAHAAMEAPGSRTRAYEAVLSQPDLRTAEDTARLGRALSEELRNTGYNCAWKDAANLGEAFMHQLNTPAARAALAARGLEAPGSRTRLYEAVMDAPLASGPEELGALGKQVSETLRGTTYQCAWQDAARAGQAFVEQLDTPAARAALRATDLEAPGSRTRLYEAVMADPTPADARSLGELGKKVSQELRGTTYSCAWRDARRAGKAFVEELRTFPDSALLAEAAAAVGTTNNPGSEVRLYEAVLADPTRRDCLALADEVAAEIPASYTNRAADVEQIRQALGSAFSMTSLDEEARAFLELATEGLPTGARQALIQTLAASPAAPARAADAAVRTLRGRGDEAWRQLAVRSMQRLEPERQLDSAEHAAAALEVLATYVAPKAGGDIVHDDDQVVIDGYAVSVRG